MMFSSATSFNADIGAWDVSQVTTMDNMFHNAENFDQKLCCNNAKAKNNVKDMFTSAKVEALRLDVITYFCFHN